MAVAGRWTISRDGSTVTPMPRRNRAARALAGLLALGALGGTAMAFELKSPAFTQGGDIPKKHTCDGPDLSPRLEWTSPPAGTKALALVCEDPDAPAGLWVHWVLWGIPPTANSLPEGVKQERSLADGSRQGRNDFGKLGHNGPCPPRGKPHRFYFRLYALDAAPSLEPGATRQQLLDAIKGHVLGEAELMGRYGRS
jgi:Raf kinase inhibitor-like YbhB/YbcL family protein